MQKGSVLFVCTGNSCHSQMAQAFLQRYAGDKFEVHSAGLKPGVINPLTYRVMREIGYDLAGQSSKGIQVYEGKLAFDYLITVCDEAAENCPVIFMKDAQRLHWSFEDPARFEGNPEERLNKFRQVRDQIAQRVRDWMKDLESNRTARWVKKQ